MNKGSFSSITWLNIPRLGLGFCIGLDEDSRWVMDHHGELLVLTDKALLYLLPLLRMRHEDVGIAVVEGLSSESKPVDLVENFPKADLVMFALGEASAFWKDLALDWVEAGVNSEQIADQAIRLTQQSNFPPSLRKKARRVVAALSDSPAT